MSRFVMQEQEMQKCSTDTPVSDAVSPSALGHASFVTGTFADDVALLRIAFLPLQVSDSTLVRLSDASRMICCPAGRFTLGSPRRPEPSWWVVRHGCASLGRIAADGAFVERHLIGPGEWFDVTGALDMPGGWAESAVIREPIELLALPLESLFEACDSDETFARAFGHTLATRMRELALHRPDVPSSRDSMSPAELADLRSHARLPGDPLAQIRR
ncbi:hypothetical protein CKO44_19070 [Rubrivivax gelatinosus]|uniref:Cyclic nucleotide-binding domain-containing protein n=2 Tax=Rubrivivax gelatinosus TaxID=28068 RepID=A0ABS1DXX9_RUBGE|nr:hypothetical protein [Rubrivivax gelatinosus]MBK1714363.1 hypothetical protein [Rubrivivax gelatinosus]